MRHNDITDKILSVIVWAFGILAVLMLPALGIGFYLIYRSLFAAMISGAL